MAGFGGNQRRTLLSKLTMFAQHVDVASGTALRAEMANNRADAGRLIDWIKAGCKNANTAFTEGPERQVAYAIEDALRRDQTIGQQQ